MRIQARRLRILISSMAVFSATALAQDISDRGGKFDWSIQLNGAGSEQFDGSNGSNASVDSSVGAGFDFAYNVNNHWAFGGGFSWREADYSAQVTPAAGNPNPAFNVSGTLETNTTYLSATYHFSPGRLSPFVNAAVGRTRVDTNIPDGPPQSVCWVDPWWGGYCGTTVPTKADTFWSYGLNLGVRWDSHGPFFLRASVGQQWIDVGHEVGTADFTQYRLDFGMRF